MTLEQLRTIGQIVICLVILAIGAYIQITQGHIPAPWDTLMLAVLAVLGLGDGIRLLVNRRNHRVMDKYLTKENRHDNRYHP